jgi:hypothetical protein
MSEQQSQKRGARSDAQKTERARDGYAPIPPSNAVAGASGDRDRETQTDQDAALQHSSKNPSPKPRRVAKPGGRFEAAEGGRYGRDIRLKSDHRS